MDYCFLKGYLVFFMIQHCTSEGLSTHNRSSAVATFQNDQALQPEPVAPEDAVVVVVPPSLQKVQEAAQVASEQVESGRAEEMLKVLMEKVIEAAMGQVEGRSEVKRDEAAVQDAVTEKVLGDEEEEGHTQTHVTNKEVEGEYKGAKEEARDIAELEGGIIAGSMEETTTGIEKGGREGVEEVINVSLDGDVSHKVIKETIAALEETGRDLTIHETEVEDNNEQVVLSKRKGEHEPQNKEQAEETPAAVKVVLGGELVSVEKSTLEVFGVAQTGDVGGKEEKTEVDKKEREVMIKPDSYDTKHTVEEQEENLVVLSEAAEVENKQDQTVREGGLAKEKKAEGRVVVEVSEGKKDGESEISETLVNKGGDQKAGEAEGAQVSLQTSHGSETEDQGHRDAAEASMKQSLENQATTTSPSLTGVETGETNLGDVKFNNGNEINTPTNELMAHNHVVAKPTHGNLVKDVLAGRPQVEGHEPETNELMEDTARTTETMELGLQAWKIGAICAAVFLVLETVVIFYILKCRNKSSAPALQQECEEGCMEPEEATGGDCSDDTLPADMEDTEQIAVLQPVDMASTFNHNKEQHKGGHGTALSDVTSISTQNSANTGQGTNFSQDLRTSIL